MSMKVSKIVTSQNWTASFSCGIEMDEVSDLVDGKVRTHHFDCWSKQNRIMKSESVLCLGI
jgi:hypothetical protein